MLPRTGLTCVKYMSRIKEMIRRGSDVFQMFAAAHKTNFEFHAGINRWVAKKQQTHNVGERLVTYIPLHGAEISGAFMVTVVLCQVCRGESITVLFCRAHVIGQQDFATLRKGRGQYCQNSNMSDISLQEDCGFRDRTTAK